MLLTIHTTHQPATDLGYLLHKHPDRFHSFELSFGQAHVFYPELGEQAITAAIPLDIAQNWSTNRCRWSRSWTSCPSAAERNRCIAFLNRSVRRSKRHASRWMKNFFILAIVPTTACDWPVRK